MLPASYATPTAIVLAVGGLLACFAGYRLFRIVLGIYRIRRRRAGDDVADGRRRARSRIVAAAIVGGLVGSLLMVRGVLHRRRAGRRRARRARAQCRSGAW